MLENFFNETANFGSTTKPGKAVKAKYQGQTVTDMRQDLVERAQATIDALDAYQGGALRAPMARSVRNAIEVKIGYGKRNVGFFEGKGDDRVTIISERYYAQKEAFIAAAYLRKVINLVNAGEFDALLAKTLAAMAAKFTKEEEPKQETEQQGLIEQEKRDLITSNVTPILSAA